MFSPDSLAASTKYAFVGLLSLVFSLGLTRLMIWLGPKLGLMDLPDARRIHESPTPRAGGLAIFVAFHLTLAAYFLLGTSYDFDGEMKEWWLAFLPASMLLLAVGIWDDRFGLNALLKLAGQVAAMVVFFHFSRINIGTLMGYHLPVMLNLPVTVLWGVAIINAFNLIDGLDGLCAGLGIISALGLGLASYLPGNPGNALLALTLVGALAGFLRYNFNPARIFLGDTGSMFIGLALSTMSLLGAHKSTLVVSMVMPMVAAGVPLMDTILAVWRRSFRQVLAKAEGTKAGKIMAPDREHLHHRLLAMGLTQRRVAIVLYLVNVALVALGLISIFSTRLTIALILVLFIAVVYVVVRHLIHVEMWTTGRLVFQEIRRPGRLLVTLVMYPLWDIFWLGCSFLLVIHWTQRAPAAVISTLNANEIKALANWPYVRYHLGLALPWVAPAFIVLVLAQTYQRLWARVSFRDFFVLCVAVFVGCAVSYLAITPFVRDFAIHDFLFVCLLSEAGIVGARMLVSVLREWTVSLATRAPQALALTAAKPALLYGAGERGGLFVRQLRNLGPDGMAVRAVLGFLDDDVRLRRHFAHGLQVLGTLEELPALRKSLGFAEVIITTTLRPERQDLLLAMARAQGLAVREWKPVMTTLLEGENNPV